MFRYFSIVILTLSLAFGASPHHPRLRAARSAVTRQATGTGNQVITTIAGGAWRAFPKTTIPAVGAPLGTTYSPALDKQGNIYVADSYNNIVVRIAPDGTLTLLAGNGNAGFSGDGGSAVVASLNRPSGIAIDAAGNLYIADYNNHRIRKVSNGIITTVAGTGVPGYYGDNDAALSARLNYPNAVAVDSAGNLYIVDQFNAAIREVTNGTIKTVAGSGNTGFFGDGGQATKAWLNNPQGVTIDSAGVLYIADTGNNRIRKVANGIITTVIGNGNYGFSGDGASAATATLAGPGAVAVDASGQQLFVADSGNNRIRRVAAGAITTIAGNGANGFAGDGGPATAASFSAPNGILIDATGQLFIADFFNKRVRKIAGGNVTTLAGGGQGTLFGDGGPAASAALLNVGDVAVDSSGNLYIADGGNSSVRKVVGGNITTVAGNGVAGFSGDRGSATSASLSFPTSIAVDTAGNIYIADTDNNRVRKVSAGIITTVAGTGTAGFSGDNGPATSAALNSPEGVAVDAAGNLYIADLGNHRVRKVSNGTITTVAGSGVNGFSGDGALATAAELSFPERVVLDPAGNLYIADTGNDRIRKVSGGKISTAAGGFINGADDSFSSPVGIAIDSAGNLLIADALNNRVRRLSGGVISTIAGNGAAGYFGDGGPAINASFANPYGVAVDGSGNVYVADTFNYRVRAVLNNVPTYQTSPVSLTFTANAGSAPTASQAITLASTVPNLAFTATASAPWLIVTPASGSIPTSLQVSVDPSTLAAGTYQGTITISTPYANPATTNVAVALTVQGSTPAQLTVGTQILTFISLQGGAAQTGPLQLSNTGGGSLSYTAVPSTTSGGAWLSVSPASGTATPSSPASLTVTATPGTLPAGTYQGSIAISGAGSTARVTVTMSINNPTANILLSQSGLSFNAVEQGGIPLPQTFGILNTGQGSMTWSATASTTSGGSNWLKISPASGSVSTPYVDVSTVTVSIDPTGLTAGTYYGRIQVTSPAVNSPQILMVVLTVQPAGTTPGPEVRPTGLIFTGSAGASPGSQDVMLGNPKPAMDNYLSANIGKGYSYLPTNADVPSNQPTTLRVFPDFSQLQPGEIERGTITLQFSDGTPRNVTVLVVVAPSGTTTSAVGLLDTGSCNKPTLEIQTRSPIQNFNGVLGQPVTVEVQVIDACGNLIGPANPKGPTVVATFSNKDADLHLTHIGNGVWSGTWRPVSPASGPVNIAVTAFNSTTSSLESGQRTWSGNLTAGNTPTVTAGGVVHAASALGGVPVAPGSLITIYGSNLADATGLASSLPLPQLQDGAQVLMGNLTLPILYTSSGQINVQVPFSTPINTQYQLSVQRDNSISVPEQLVVAAAQPGVFTVNQQGNGQGVIFKSDGVTLAQPDTPATAGETVVVYCTGLGAVNPPVPEGTPPPSSPLSNTVNTVTVTIGGQDAPVQFSGLTPGFPGLYQVNAVVPAGVSGDAVTLVLNVAGQSSPPVTLAIQ